MGGNAIFIIGCPRSGTTLLRLALDSHPNISSGPETHFLVDLSKIMGQHWKRIRLFGFDEAYWYNKIADFFDSFQMDYARKRGKVRWCEKTPLYTAHLGFINRLFPDAQFLHIIRNGLDVVASYRDRWGYLSAMKAPRTWDKYIRMARAAAETILTDRYLELRYEELVSHPEDTLRRVLDHLNEPWDSAVLDYRRVEHDRTDKRDNFMQMRRTNGHDESAIYQSRVGAGASKLDPLLRMVVWLRAGPLMRELGYR